MLICISLQFISVNFYIHLRIDARNFSDASNALCHTATIYNSNSISINSKVKSFIVSLMCHPKPVFCITTISLLSAGCHVPNRSLKSLHLIFLLVSEVLILVSKPGDSPTSIPLQSIANYC
jgi:hypothetical protein